MAAYDKVPEEMKKLPQWVCWKYKDDVDKAGKQRRSKLPCTIKGKLASTTNPDTWATFEDVVNAVTSEKVADGIGFVFTEACGIVGVDFDHVRTFKNEFTEGVIEEVEALNSYTELSPSETGLHVYLYGKKKGTDCKFKLTDKTDREIYDSGRFFTVTGKSMSSESVINESQEGLDIVYDKWVNLSLGNRSSKKEKTVKPLVKSPKMEDNEIIRLCKSASNGEKFERLFEGYTDEYNNDASAADQALCNMIAFYTQDPEQIDRIFRTSNLARDKWDREDYRNSTITNAINVLTDTYKAAEENKKAKPKKIEVPFDIVADDILKNHHIFSMRDNGEIYLYKDGVYRSEGTEAILDTKARDIHDAYYMKFWFETNKDFPLGHIPKATKNYISEVLAYIRAYTHINRSDIDEEQNNYINFKNCLFNIESWKVESHTPKIRLIGQINAEYNQKATCPLIMKYFKDCELSQVDLDTLIEFSGYSLTSLVRMQKALMLHGNGSNGKSVFINLLKIIIGKDYTSGETLQNLEEDKYRVANLYGKRLNAFPDLKDKPLQTNEVFNTLTGNDLFLTGERKYQNAFEFKPTAKLMFSANKPPYAHSDNYAYYRRWIMIKFPHTFEKEEIDEMLLLKLSTEEEKSGFVNLMLEGLKRVLTNKKFTKDIEVKDVEKEYILHSDNVTVFEEECLRDCSGNEEPTEKNSVYEGYVAWCKTKDLIPIKPKSFTKRLEKLGRKVYNTTKYDIIGKSRNWFSCYYNTVFDYQTHF